VKLYKVDAIVLRSVNMREADQILTLFSLERGKIRAVAYGACKPTSKKRGAVQPFSYTRFLLRQGRELDSVSQCEGLELFWELRQQLKSLIYATYLTEMVDALTMPGEAQKEIYWLLLNTLRLMASSDPELLTRFFEVKLVNCLGYRPFLDECAVCRGSLNNGRVGFYPAAGGVLCAACARKEPDSFWCYRGTVAWLKLFLRWPAAKLRQIKVSPELKKEMRLIMQKHLEYHLEHQPKSARFLELMYKI